MLELKNVCISLSQSGRTLTDNFTFTLNKGDKAVIIGEEGNGKSTLLKLIFDKEAVEGYCSVSGSITAKGTLGYLPQLPDDEILQMSVAEYFESDAEHLHTEISPLPGISAALMRSGQKISTLSGGEKVKIQLAKILMAQPDILLLDEPTNDIDIDTLKYLENFINSTPLPVLFVSHDETLIENTANVIIHIEQLVRKSKCRITVTHSGYSEYIESRSAAFDKQLQVAKKQRSDYAQQMNKWQQIYSRVDCEQETITRADPGGGRLLKKKMKAVKSQQKRLDRQAEDFLEIPQVEQAILTEFDKSISLPRGKVVLELSLDRLCVAEKELARNVTLKVVGNEHIGIIGKNGAGKSTLLGEIRTALENRSGITVCCMPQNYADMLDYSLSPVQYLARNYSKADVTRARTYMGSMKFTHEEMTGKIGALSGGQKAKILFLDMVLKNANVLLLDEPTRNFSPLSTPVVRRALSEYGGAIISISHDRKYLDEVCDKIYRLNANGLALLNKSDVL